MRKASFDFIRLTNCLYDLHKRKGRAFQIVTFCKLIFDNFYLTVICSVAFLIIELQVFPIIHMNHLFKNFTVYPHLHERHDS